MRHTANLSLYLRWIIHQPESDPQGKLGDRFMGHGPQTANLSPYARSQSSSPAILRPTRAIAFGDQLEALVSLKRGFVGWKPGGWRGWDRAPGEGGWW